MSAENPFEFSANALDRRPGTRISNIRMQAHPQYVPRFESMSQHEQFCFGIRSRSDRGAAQPRIANLTCIGSAAAVQRMSRRPGPALDIEESRRSDDDVIRHPNGGKRNRRSCLQPGKSRINVADSFIFALRDGTPLIQARRSIRKLVNRRGGYQAVDMTMIQRFETNPPAGQNNIFRFHISSMQRSAYRGNET